MASSARSPVVAGAFFVFLAWLVAFIGLRWQAGIRSADAGTAAIGNPGLADRAAGQWFELSLTIIFLLCALSIPGSAGIGARMPSSRPIGNSIHAFTWALLAFVATGYIAAFIDSDTSTAEASRQFSVATRARVSLHAGITEETYNLVIPATVIVLLVGGINRVRHNRRTPPLPVPSWAVAAACLVGVGTRYIEHLYQGEINTAKQLVLGGLLIGIFVFWRSVWPIAAAHSLFDFVLTSRLMPDVQALILAGGPVLLIIVITTRLVTSRAPAPVCQSPAAE